MAVLSLFVDLDHVCEVREFVGRIGKDLALDSQVIFELQLAVEEACSNVVLHAYDGQGGGAGGRPRTGRRWGAGGPT